MSQKSRKTGPVASLAAGSIAAGDKLLSVGVKELAEAAK